VLEYYYQTGGNMETFISLSKEWTKEQKEVWDIVEDHWNCLVNGKDR